MTETKYFTTSDYNKFPGEIFNAKIKEKGLVDKSNISEFINTFDLENCNISNKELFISVVKVILKMMDIRIV